MFDVLIIGGGPAGLTAGIYAARGGKKTAVLEKTAHGGQAAITPSIENYPGVENVSGFELTAIMARQAQSFGVEFVYGELVSAELNGRVKKITLSDGSVYEAGTVIITSGSNHRKLGVPGEDAYLGAGLSYCATCDGAFFKNKPVAVAGGGNTAVEDALYLLNFASEVFLIHRRGELRASEILQSRVKESEVKIIWDSVVKRLSGTPKLTEIAVENVKTHTLTELSVNGLFVAIGQTPASAAFETVLGGIAETESRGGKLKVDSDGYIITDANMATDIDGVFAAGDVRKTPLRQVVTACADGAVAANSAIAFLNLRR